MESQIPFTSFSAQARPHVSSAKACTPLGGCSPCFDSVWLSRLPALCTHSLYSSLLAPFPLIVPLMGRIKAACACIHTRLTHLPILANTLGSYWESFLTREGKLGLLFLFLTEGPQRMFLWNSLTVTPTEWTFDWTPALDVYWVFGSRSFLSTYCQNLCNLSSVSVACRPHVSLSPALSHRTLLSYMEVLRMVTQKVPNKLGHCYAICVRVFSCLPDCSNGESFDISD